MKGLFGCLLALFGAFSLKAQDIYLQGYVEDGTSTERLVGATVAFPDLNLITYTNQYGFFQQKIPAGKTTLEVRFLGFQSKRFDLIFLKDTSLTISLTDTVKELEVVEITAEQGITGDLLGKLKLNQAQIKEMPLIGGEADAIKAMQFLPGVQGGAEGSSSLYVRGGSPDQNLILLDGAPSYNTSHAFGLFSIFNPSAIKDIALYKGGISAQYGERLSSVVDITLKEGNRKYTQGNLELGPIGIKGFIEGPLGQKHLEDAAKTSFIISGRRTFVDLFTRPYQVLSGAENRTGFHFYDLSAKINHRFSPDNQIFASFYTGRDALNLGTVFNQKTDSSSITNRLIQRMGWGNQTAVLRWNWLVSNKIFSNLSVYYSRYYLDADLRSKIRQITNGTENRIESGSVFQSNLQEGSLKWNSSWNFAPKNTLRTGFLLQRYGFSPGAIQFISEGDSLIRGDSVLAASKLNFWAGATYVEHSFQAGRRIKGNLGLRFSAMQGKEKVYSYFQPRANLQSQINESLSIQIGYTQNVQFLHLLTNSSVPLPVDLWVPSTDLVAPSTSRQVSLGIGGSLEKNVWSWHIEGFFKRMENLITYEEGANFFEEEPIPTNLSPSSNWENEVELNGKGQSYGTEILLQKNKGRFKGWLAYTLSWNWREFEELNDGNRFPYTYDRRHDLSIITDVKINEQRSIYFNWVIQSGQATTLPLGEYTSIGGEKVLIFSKRNEFRFPLYHRLDLGYTGRKSKPYGMRIFRIGAYNAYSRRNAYSVSVITLDGKPFIYANSLFPIVPYLSIEWVFDKN
ncbi:MAG: TonB-dependent receptor plug domain-containing protein [Bacteroidia bacterium]